LRHAANAGILRSARLCRRRYRIGVPTPSLLDTRTAADDLADADHFDKWADRVRDNEGLGAAFRRLARDARSRAITRQAHERPRIGG
jgi:hypothetical protein